MTFEKRVVLMKPLSANELEVLQEFANGLGTTRSRPAGELQSR
jgi:hypothetical protein